MLTISEENLERLYRMMLKGNTAAEIGAVIGESEANVRNLGKRFFPYLRDLDFYEEHKTKLFEAVQRMGVKRMIQLVPQAHLRDVVSMVGMLEDKIRNRKGQSTEIIGFKIEELVKRKEKVVNALRSEGMEEDLIDDAARAKLALSFDGMIMPVTPPCTEEFRQCTIW